MSRLVDLRTHVPTLTPTTGRPAVLDAFTTIGLDELLERASLQTRVDRKYVVPRAALDGLLGGLDASTRLLRIGDDDTFAYESVYFDTPDLASYLGAARRRRRRFKVRTRTYVDSDECFVEVKTRGPRGATVKNRLPYDPDDRDRLTTEAMGFAGDVLDDRDVPAPDDTLFTPTLISRYRRTTFLLPGGATDPWSRPAPDARMTVDTDLTWTTLGPEGVRTLPVPHLVVVETKTGSTPSAADRLLWRHGYRPVRISKYGTGMAALHPHLPATPWRRVLDKHVTTPSSPR